MIPFTKGQWEYYKYGGIVSRQTNEKAEFVAVINDEFDTGLDLEFKNKADELLVFKSTEMYQVLFRLAEWSCTKTFYSPEEEKLFSEVQNLVYGLEKSFHRGEL